MIEGMSSARNLEDILHDYLDGLEDIDRDLAARIVLALDGFLRPNGTPDERAIMAFVASASSDETRARIVDALIRQIAPDLLRGVTSLTRSTAVSLAPAAITTRIEEAAKALRVSPPARAAMSSLRRLVDTGLRGTQDRVRQEIEGIAMTSRGEDAARALIAKLRKDLNEGGPILGRLVDAKAWGEELKPLVGRFADDQLALTSLKATKPGLSADELASGLGSVDLVWVAALVRTCPVCLTNHGQSDTRANWQLRGMPPLHDHCRCVLIPQAGEYADFADPLRDEATNLKALNRADKIEGQKLDVTYRIPSDLLGREKAGRDVVVNATTGEVVDKRRNRILRAAQTDPAVARTIRKLGNLNASSSSGSGDLFSEEAAP